ncbi:MAG TPA: hypothetical protein VMS55_05980 [Myxococcota bacterium]|nr:hypothetical protein [Myxococcota bacterium]
MTALRRRHHLLAALFALLAPQRAPAQPGQYALQEIARAGDPAPGGGVMTYLLGVDIDESGRVLFHASVSPPPFTSDVIAVFDGVSLHSAVRKGELAPPPVGQPFALIYHGRLGGAGALAWGGWYRLPSTEMPSGTFVRSGGADSTRLLRGQPLPGGGTVYGINYVWDMNDAGDVLVQVTLDSGLTALLLARSTGVIEVEREGQATPAGGVFAALDPVRPWLGEDGSVLFPAAIVGSGVQYAVFERSAGGSLSVVVSQGDPLLTARGGTVENIFAASRSRSGDLYVTGWVLRPSQLDAQVVAVIGDSAREIVASEDVLPGMNGEHFLGVLNGLPRMNAAGDVMLPVLTAESYQHAVFVSRDGVLHPVIREGDPIPGRPGEAFRSVDDAAFNDAGQIAIAISSSNGSTSVFLATPAPAEVPLAPPLTFIALGAGIVAAARRYTRLVRSFQNGSRKVRFRIFPEPVRGSSPMNEIERGTL